MGRVTQQNWSPEYPARFTRTFVNDWLIRCPKYATWMPMETLDWVFRQRFVPH